MEYTSFNSLLEKGICGNWEREALSNFDGSTLRYKDVAWEIVKLQEMFSLCGIRKGDKIALCSRNQARWGVVFMAALSAGAVPVPILHEYKPGNIHYLVGHSEARLLFAGSNILENITDSAMPALEAIIRVDDLKVITAREAGLQAALDGVDEVLRARYAAGFGPCDLEFFRDAPEDLAIINYTSGTSGFAKGVMLPYRSLLANVRLMAEVFPRLGSGSNVVAMLPSAHMYGLMMDLIYEMTVGAHVHFLTRAPSPKVIFDSFSRIRPDIVITVPLIIEKIARQILRRIAGDGRPGRLDAAQKARIRGELDAAFGGNFSQVVIGGAPLNAEVEDLLAAVGFRYTVGSGMTESAPLVSLSPWDATKIQSCGRVAPYLKVRIDSEDAASIPGEIYLKGGSLFLGYYKMPKETAEVLGPDGWFRTGDIGTLDADGFLALKGRSKNMILTASGQNIYPEEIESQLNNLPYVQEALVVLQGRQLVALIYPDRQRVESDRLGEEDLCQVLKAEVRALCDQMPGYCNIAKVEIFPEEFEKTPKKSIKRYLYQRN